MKKIILLSFLILAPLFAKAQITQADLDALKLSPDQLGVENVLDRLREVVAETYGELNAMKLTHFDFILSTDGSQSPGGPFIVVGDLNETERLVCRVEIASVTVTNKIEEAALCVKRSISN